MPRARNPDMDQAKEMFLKGMKLVEIASQLNLPEGTIRSWKNRYNWNATLQTGKRNVAKRKKGGQPGNKNAVDAGAPEQNKNAEKYGFLTKYLPPETLDIFNETNQASPLDLLWHQIQIAYAAIIRAQQIAYVKDQNDKTKETVMSGDTAEAYSIQEAWDKQANFMKAQAAAQSQLRSMIKQYDEMLHQDWHLATEEQRARIEVLKAKTSGKDNADELAKLDEMLSELKESAGKEDDTKSETDGVRPELQPPV